MTGITSTVASAIADRQLLRYAGYAYDAYSATYYLSARHYDPATMRFLTKDPARDDGEESAYQYCAGDPVGKVDPTGQFAVAPLLANPSVPIAMQKMADSIGRAALWIGGAAAAAFTSSALIRYLKSVANPGSWSANYHAYRHVGQKVLEQVLRNRRLWIETRLSPVKLINPQTQRIKVQPGPFAMIVSRAPSGVSYPKGKDRVMVIGDPMRRRVITAVFESSTRVERIKKRDGYFIQLSPSKQAQWRYRPDPL